MRKIGQGRTAEVFDLENGRVVKLMLPGFPEKELQEELHCAQEVGQFDLPAPKCYGIVEMDGRKGLVYDLAAGESLRAEAISAKMENSTASTRPMTLQCFLEPRPSCR